MEYDISLTLTSDPVTGRRRNTASHDAILDATYVLLEEIGFDKLSLEGVAARAGVGKATIYRWWSGKNALVMEALLREAAPMAAFPETGSARSAFEAQIRGDAELYRGKTGRIVADMIGLSQFDADSMRLFNENYLYPRRAKARHVLGNGIAQGEFKPDIDPDLVLDLLYGPIFYRLMRHAAIDEHTLDAHLQLVLGSISATPPT